MILRCLRKSPERRFQHMADLQVALEELKEESASGRLASPVRPTASRGSLWSILAAAFGLALLAAALLFRAPHLAPQLPSQGLRRLTYSGASFGPEISKDGKLLAYSDVALDRVPNVFVRQIAGGSILQITHEPEGCASWKFSPDGGHILYTTLSNKIYEIPALGGGPRLVITGARGASYNLDGSGIVYLDDKSILRTAQLDGTGSRVYLPGFMVYAGTIAPDAKRALLTGAHSNGPESERRIWLLSIPRT